MPSLLYSCLCSTQSNPPSQPLHCNLRSSICREDLCGYGCKQWDGKGVRLLVGLLGSRGAPRAAQELAVISSAKLIEADCNHLQHSSWAWHPLGWGSARPVFIPQADTAAPSKRGSRNAANTPWLINTEPEQAVRTGRCCRQREGWWRVCNISLWGGGCSFFFGSHPGPGV